MEDTPYEIASLKKEIDLLKSQVATKEKLLLEMITDYYCTELELLSYLKKYGLTDSDLKEICLELSDEDIYTISYMDTRVKKILNFLSSLGITNVKELILYVPFIFDLHFDELWNCIRECEDPYTIAKLKENVENFYDIMGV